MQITYVVDVSWNDTKMILECWANNYSYRFNTFVNDRTYSKISLNDWEGENIVYNCERIPKP